MPDIFVSSSNPPPKPTETPKITPDNLPEAETERAKYKGHTHSRFAAFSMFPERVKFETKEEDEKVVLLLRQHPIVNVPWILLVIAMIFVPIIVGALGILSSLPPGFGLIVNMSWYLLTMAIAMENFLNWFFNVYIVTNTRVVDIDFVNLIYKNVSDANLDKIQDVSYNMGGVVRTVFNFGDVVIQTAAEIEQFDFMAVPNPAKVAKVIQDLAIAESKKEHE
jgi:hypothetical protein